MLYKVLLEHVQDVVEVGVCVFVRTRGDDWHVVPGGAIMGLNTRPRIDLEKSPCRQVCPVPHPRVQLLGRVETRLEDGNDQIVRWVVRGAAIKPADSTRETYRGVNGLGIGDIP